MSQTDRRDWICFLIGLGTFTIFLPVLWFDFTNYDDLGYIVNNAHVTTGLSVRSFIWALTTLHGQISYWHPVTWFPSKGRGRWRQCAPPRRSEKQNKQNNVRLVAINRSLLTELSRETPRLGVRLMVVIKILGALSQAKDDLPRQENYMPVAGQDIVTLAMPWSSYLGRII